MKMFTKSGFYSVCDSDECLIFKIILTRHLARPAFIIIIIISFQSDLILLIIISRLKTNFTFPEVEIPFHSEK